MKDIQQTGMQQQRNTTSTMAVIMCSGDLMTQKNESKKKLQAKH